MKIKHKIVGIFIISVLISVLVFSCTVYMLLNKGYYAGISIEEMNLVTEDVARQIEGSSQLSDQSIAEILKAVSKEDSKMCVEVLFPSGKRIHGNKTSGITSVSELMKSLSYNNMYSSEEWVVCKAVKINAKEAYIVNTASKSDLKTITYQFNGPKAKGILGKIALMGVAMTLLISSLFTYLFTKKIMKRVKAVYIAIEDFELGNLKLRIEDKKNDELGKLAYSFNDMADKIEEQVEKQNEYEEKRKQLISNLSHDLRTPLSSVVGYSELMLDEVGNKQDDRKYLEIIHRKALYMEKLLNQLLEFSRLESGSLKVNLEEADIVECMREILIEYIPSLDKDHIELILEMGEEPILIWFDREKVERVIRNLIDNALKYGMDGRKLRIGIYQKSEDVIVEIEDFGKGMNKETLSHLFERFYRGEKGRGTKAGGMGLGLSIAQEIVKRHKGSLSIVSELGKGTCTRIKLPLK